MKTRKQKRYTSEEEILRKIDNVRSDMAKTRVKLNTKRMSQEEVDAANAKIRRIEDSTLPNLGRTLAAFRTRLLPGITTDDAVVLKRA